MENRNFLVAFVAKMDGLLETHDHINSVAITHKGMPTMEELKDQIGVALEKGTPRPGYKVVAVTILGLSELSTEDIATYIKDSDDVTIVNMD